MYILVDESVFLGSISSTPLSCSLGNRDQRRARQVARIKLFPLYIKM